MGNMSGNSHTHDATNVSRTPENGTRNGHCNPAFYQQQTQTQIESKDNIDVNMVCDTQILLDTIQDIWLTIGEHIKFSRNKPGILNILSSEQDHRMKLLYKMDSLMIILKMFGISCQRYKKLNQLSALNVGKCKVTQLYSELDNKAKANYQPFVHVLNNLLKGDKMHFKKRTKGYNESKVKISQGGMSTVMNQLIGGQHQTNKNIDEYKKHKRAYKLHKQHNVLKTQHPPGHAFPKDVAKLYEAVGISDLQFETQLPNINIDGKSKREYIRNAFIKDGQDYVVLCELLEDPRISKDGKVSVKNAGSGLEWRPHITDIVYIDDDKRHYNAIYEFEQDYMRKYGKLGYAPLQRIDKPTKLPDDQTSTMKQHDNVSNNNVISKSKAGSMDVDPPNIDDETAN
mmetsp:Transcript_13307/g.16427  ORF Transcript_13307/g.16427 Transcript_13307/m.16427 type:complete len:399 (+) Transcript_13307:41-1237(+)